MNKRSTPEGEGKGKAAYAVPAEMDDAALDLRELTAKFYAHIKLILAIAVLVAAMLAAYTKYFATPIYEATSKLYVVNSNDSAINLSDLEIGSYLAVDYIEVFNTWEVHSMVIQDLSLPYSYAQMQDMLKVTNPTGPRILYISVRNPSAKAAADIANDYAKVAIRYIADTMSTDEPNIMSAALVPASPISPSVARNAAIGFLGGLIATMLIIAIRFFADDKIKSAEEVYKSAGLSVLAVIPRIKHVKKKNGRNG
jgi:capsular polysaccharide biosynthesis protein